jgi:hypothetical protein
LVLRQQKLRQAQKKLALMEHYNEVLLLLNHNLRFKSGHVDLIIGGRSSADYRQIRIDIEEDAMFPTLAKMLKTDLMNKKEALALEIEQLMGVPQ